MERNKEEKTELSKATHTAIRVRPDGNKIIRTHFVKREDGSVFGFEAEIEEGSLIRNRSPRSDEINVGEYEWKEIKLPEGKTT